MKQLLGAFTFLLLNSGLHAQDVPGRLARAISQLEQSPEMKHGLISLTVEDASGNSVFTRNSEMGMAVASSQKVLTSAASFEILNNDFRFRTTVSYRGTIAAGVLKGDLIFHGSGDPSLGSWRWTSTRPEKFLASIVEAVRISKISRINGSIIIDTTGFSNQSIPDGWIWQDIGNYYGAGAAKLNWKENQYDLHLKSASQINREVEILNDNDSAGKRDVYLNELRSAEKGSGDNANIYLPIGSSKPLVSGSIPRGENNFVISGAMPEPAATFAFELEKALYNAGIYTMHLLNSESAKGPEIALSNYSSPSLDSLNFWFLRRSVNLYGEAFVKAIAFYKNEYASTDAGVEHVREFWSRNGIEKSAIKMLDGSGLSPQNRVTTRALVQVMQFASQKKWFNSFYDALPTINGLKMKSGSIGGARSFTGYIRNSSGIRYVFAIVVNNYDGSSSAIVQKLYAILDILK